MRLLKIVSIFLVGITMIFTLLYRNSHIQAVLAASVSFTGASAYNVGISLESVVNGCFSC